MDIFITPKLGSLSLLLSHSVTICLLVRTHSNDDVIRVHVIVPINRH